MLIIVSDLAVGNSSESIVEACLLGEQPKSHHTLAKMMGNFYSKFKFNFAREYSLANFSYVIFSTLFCKYFFGEYAKGI